MIDFQTEGFQIHRSFYDLDEHVRPILDEVEQLGNFVAPGFRCDQTETLDPRVQSSVYKALRYLPSLARLASARRNLEVCREIGIEGPALMHSSNIRMDAPQGDGFRFHWHQDLTYLLGSQNSVTFWIPLTRVDRERGTIEILPGSHRRGLAPFRFTDRKPLTPTAVMAPRDIVLEEEPEEEGLFVEAEPGDLVVFSQLLLHRSSPNRSRQIRWTAQLRFADLFDRQFLEDGYPFGDHTNIFHTEYPDRLGTSGLRADAVQS